MKKAKVLVALLLCAAIAFAGAACGSKKADTPAATPAGGSSAPAAEDQGEGGGSARDTLTVAVSLDSGTLDPLNITGFGGYLNIVPCYMEPLVDYKAGAEPVYLLAESVEEVNPIEYTVNLRQGVQFSNGNPLTAEDVLFSMNREKEHPSRMLDVQFVDWEKTAIVDDYTIDLWFTQFTPMNLIKMGQLQIIDKESFDEQEMSLRPIGTGPYVVTDYVVNSHVSLEANPNYWGKQPAIKKLEFKCMNETSQMTNALETGTVDYSGIPTKDVEYVESLGGYNIQQTFPGAAIAVFFNMSKGGIMGSKDARDAVCYAVDRESWADVAFNGYGTITEWPMATNLLDFKPENANQDDTYKTGYDLEKAKALAEKSGLAGKDIRIITNGAENYVTMAELYQADLKQIGVNAEIINYDQATYYGMIMDPSKYEIALYSTSAPAMLASDIMGNYPTFFTLGWDDKERLAFVEKGQEVLAEPDDAKRDELLQGLVTEFYKYSPWYGVCNMPTMCAVAKDIEGFEWWLTGDVRYQDWSFK